MFLKMEKLILIIKTKLAGQPYTVPALLVVILLLLYYWRMGLMSTPKPTMVKCLCIMLPVKTTRVSTFKTFIKNWVYLEALKINITQSNHKIWLGIHGVRSFHDYFRHPAVTGRERCSIKPTRQVWTCAASSCRESWLWENCWRAATSRCPSRSTW